MIRELPLNPPCDKWEEYTKPQFIEGKIFEFCEDIVKRGYRTVNPEIFSILYEYIEDRIDKYYPQDEGDI